MSTHERHTATFATPFNQSEFFLCFYARSRLKTALISATQVFQDGGAGDLWEYFLRQIEQGLDTASTAPRLIAPRSVQQQAPTPSHYHTYQQPTPIPALAVHSAYYHYPAPPTAGYVPAHPRPPPSLSGMHYNYGAVSGYPPAPYQSPYAPVTAAGLRDDERENAPTSQPQ
ncbi:hypothetical protein JCM10908_002703 [Rhodotorula pacifica]|uniref:uncharacterized protein n=1 Tax=Rhodotorula pacifica TaxID=1495444 RepID=UPI003178A77C